MLITSNFHDYYDSILSYGIDKTVVYSRRREVIPGNAIRFRDGIPLSSYSQDYERSHHGRDYIYRINGFILGFCGSLYPVVMVSTEDTKTKAIAREYFYHAQVLKTFLERESIKLGELFSFRYRKGNKHLSWDEERDVAHFFSTDAFDELKQQFASRRTPVFFFGVPPESSNVRHGEIALVLNPCLKDFEFMRIKPPVVAFQEIYMYLTGVLGAPARPMVQITDAKLAEKRGHGGKYSFRKPPREKK